MNYLNETEKTLKRWLKSKVSISMATVVGFMIAGTVVFGEDKVVNIDSNFNGTNFIESVVKGDIPDIIGNSGIELGKIGGETSVVESIGIDGLKDAIVDMGSSLISLDTIKFEGSQDLQIDKLFGAIITIKIPEKLIVTLDPIENKSTFEKNLEGNVEVNIGNEENSPLVVGAVGGDLTTSVGAWDLGVIKAEEPTSSATIQVDDFAPATIGIYNDKYDLTMKEQKYSVTRDGNISVNINNGDVLGVSTGSTALALGNMGITKENIGIKDFDLKDAIIGGLFNNINSEDLKLESKIKWPSFDLDTIIKEAIEGLTKNLEVKTDLNIMDIHLQLQGNTENIINGNTNLNIADRATVIGATAGGTALGVGGVATSTVTGDTNIKIETKDNLLTGDGITAGVFGGGVAVSTLGGEATTNSNVNKDTKTTITVNSGTTGVVVGGGLAAATDTSKLDKIIELLPEEYKPTLTEDGKIVVNLDGILDKVLPNLEDKELGNEIVEQILAQLQGIEMNVSGLNEGGTSISNFGDVEMTLNGNVTSVGVIGGGLAIANQNAESEKVSSSVVKGKDSSITIDLDGNESTAVAVDKAMDSFKNVINQITNPDNIIDNINNPNLILTEIGKVAEDLQNINFNVAVGVTGNGIAVSLDKAQAESGMENTSIKIKDGLVLGVMGNGVALADNNSNSKVTAQNTEITIENGDIYGVTGNGVAIYGGVNGGSGKAVVETENSNIAIKGGKVEGIVAGGMAVALNGSAERNAEANINGTSSITIKNATVNKLGNALINVVEDKISDTDLAKLNILGDRAAIIGGGIAVGNANSTVKDSVIDISDGTVVNGDILGGGVAVGTATVKMDTSKINIGSGVTVNGDIVAGGISLGGKLSVGKSEIELAGATVNGDIYGQGLGVDLSTIIPIIKDSSLKITSGENKAKNIYGFTDIDISKGAQLETEGITLIAGSLKNDGILALTKEGAGNTLVDLYTGKVENSGTIELGYGNTVVKNNILDGVLGKVENTGIVQLNNITKDEIEQSITKDELYAGLFQGNYTSTGIVVDKNGEVIFLDKDFSLKEEVTTDELEAVGEGNNSLILDGATISSGNDKKDETIDVASVNVVNRETNLETDLNLTADSFNFSGGSLNVKNSNLILNNGVINSTDKDSVAIVVGDTGSLTLNGVESVNANIGKENKGSLEIVGDTSFNGNLSVRDINVTGDITSNGSISFDNLLLNGTLGLSMTSSLVGGGNDSTLNLQNGELILEVGADGTTALKNSKNIDFTSGDIQLLSTEKDDADILFTTSNLEGSKIKIDLGKGNSYSGIKFGTDSAIYVIGDVTNDEAEIIYNDKLYQNGDSTVVDEVINNINTQINGGVANKYFSSNGDDFYVKRAREIDKLYSSNIYSKTIKAAYQTVKANETTILNTSKIATSKELSAIGVALTGKTTSYEDGRLGEEYKTQIETSGLMAGLEYGVNDTTSVGVVFSGAKQNVDVTGGDADGDVFYLGTYAKKEVGKLDLTAGLGYQLGRYDANNTAVLVSAKDSYDVATYSMYAQGKYSIGLGDNVTLEPKLKLGYTYINPNSISDDYFRLSDANMSTFDAEVGADLVKTVALKAGKVDVRFGTSYVRAFGDTDKKFTGDFVGGKGSFDVLGANIAEDTAKFDLSVEVKKESGAFYNVGGTLRVGSDKTRDYGVRLGAGYRF